jgi:O-antigen/teichoic acid export membrane protein
MAASRVIVLGSQFGLMLVAARFLGPAQFGLYTLLTSTALLASSTARAGWMECIMTAKSATESAQANTLALGGGLIAVALGIVAAVVFGFVESDPVAVHSAYALVASLLPACIAAPQHGVLMGRQRVVRLGQSQIVAELTSLAIGVICLNLHWGMLGLAVAKLASEATSCALLVISTRWYPLARLDIATCRRLLRVWRNFASANLMSLMSGTASVYLLGAFAGPADTGIYRAGVRFSGVASELITEPSRVTYWAVLKAAYDQGGRKGIAAAAVPLSATTMLFGAPLAIGLASTSDTLVAAALGGEWKDAGPVVALTALAIIPRLPTFLGHSVLTLTGHDRLVPRLTLWNSIVSLGCLAASVSFGAVWVSIGSLAANLLYLPICVMIMRVVEELRWKDVFKRYVPILTASLVMVALVRALPFVAPSVPPAWMLLAQVVLGAVAYLGSLYWLAPQDFRSAVALVPYRRVRSWVTR